MRISFCIITRNEEKNVPELLANLAPVADEILIVDSGSTDKTVELARNGKARVLEHPWTDYTTQKNYALQEALHSWVFVLDADERLSPTLSEEIEGIKRTFPQEEGPEGVDGFRTNRLAHYWGRPIRHSGWYPDRKVRLFRRGTGAFTGKHVHEGFSFRGRLSDTLRGDLLHYPYQDLAAHLAKINLYSGLGALRLRDEGKTFSLRRLLLHPPTRFFRHYLWKRGFLDGFRGLLIAALSSYYVFIREVRLWELENGEGSSR